MLIKGAAIALEKKNDKTLKVLVSLIMLRKEKDYDAETYQIPEHFNEILSNYVEHVIRYNPQDIADFSYHYFHAIKEGQLKQFIENWNKKVPYIKEQVHQLSSANIISKETNIK